MPYGSYANPAIAVKNALRFMKEGQVDCVKMQGGRAQVPIIRAIADAGVPVMSHVGMCPHFVHRYGGFKLQGRTADDALQIIDDALAIQEAGAIGFEIEAVPAPVGRAVHEAVNIFTFSIGAGPSGCAQLLLAFDLLGVFDQFKPKFTKRYANLSQVAVEALKTYAAEVRDGVLSRRRPQLRHEARRGREARGAAGQGPALEGAGYIPPTAAFSSSSCCSEKIDV